MFYMNHAGSFWRSSQPFALSDSDLAITQQSLGGGVVSNRINVTNPLFSGYADLGDRYEKGATLSELLARFGGPNGAVITATQPVGASPTPFGVNFWFDVNADGELFNWESAPSCPGSNAFASCDRLTGTGPDAYALGPSSPPQPAPSQRAIKLEATTPFYMQGLCGGQAKTFQELIDGSCAGIDGSTPVEIWAGTLATSGDGGKLLAIMTDPYSPLGGGGGGGTVPTPTALTTNTAAAPVLFHDGVVIISGFGTIIILAYVGHRLGMDRPTLAVLALAELSAVLITSITIAHTSDIPLEILTLVGFFVLINLLFPVIAGLRAVGLAARLTLSLVATVSLIVIAGVVVALGISITLP